MFSKIWQQKGRTVKTFARQKKMAPVFNFGFESGHENSAR
jgi:hypothetical protein